MKVGDVDILLDALCDIDVLCVEVGVVDNDLLCELVPDVDILVDSDLVSEVVTVADIVLDIEVVPDTLMDDVAVLVNVTLLEVLAVLDCDTLADEDFVSESVEVCVVEGDVFSHRKDPSKTALIT